MTYKIDKNISPPEPTIGRPPKYPFKDMKVGDSIAVPLSGDVMLSGEDRATDRLRCACIAYSRRHGGKFTVRIDRENNLARCWRIK